MSGDQMRDQYIEGTTDPLVLARRDASTEVTTTQQAPAPQVEQPSPTPEIDEQRAAAGMAWLRMDRSRN